MLPFLSVHPDTYFGAKPPFLFASRYKKSRSVIFKTITHTYLRNHCLRDRAESFSYREGPIGGCSNPPWVTKLSGSGTFTPREIWAGSHPKPGDDSPKPFQSLLTLQRGGRLRNESFPYPKGRPEASWVHESSNFGKASLNASRS